MAIARRYNPVRSVMPRLGYQWPLGLMEEMERFVDGLGWGPFGTQAVLSTLHPALDLVDEEDKFIVRAELPGISKDDIDIGIRGSVLTIKAEKKVEESKGNYYVCERSFGTLHRTIELPQDVEADKATAIFENGVLELRLPKAEESKTKHVRVRVK